MDFDLIMLILGSVVAILGGIGFTIYEFVKERRERKKTWAKIDNNPQPPAPYIEQLAHKQEFEKSAHEYMKKRVRAAMPFGEKNAKTTDELLALVERWGLDIDVFIAILSELSETKVVRNGRAATAYYRGEKHSEKSNSQPAKHYDSMSGLEFEQFCSELLKKNGFINVKTTSGSGDNGVDIFAEKDSVTYAIQCKCYSQNIGNKAVQEIYSGKDFYKRHVGVVMTNQYFTPSAKEAAERTGIILWDRDYVEKLKS